MSSTLTNTKALVNAQWLEDHFEDLTVCVVEVDVSPAAHEEGHIPGAVLWDIYSDLKDETYQPKPTSMIERLVRESGITEDSVVVFYEHAPAMGFLLIRHFGHAELRILDIARTTWQKQAQSGPWRSRRPPGQR